MPQAPLLILVISVVLGAGVGGAFVAYAASVGVPGLPPTELHWNYGCGGCTFDDGLQDPAIIHLPGIPPTETSAYVTITLSVSNWTQWNGVDNSTGACAPGVSACNAFVGLWTPAAWDAYAAGGALAPFWCYTGSGSTCSNVSSLSVTSPSLLTLNGQGIEVVIWNIAPYGLQGNFEIELDAIPYYSPG